MLERLNTTARVMNCIGVVTRPFVAETYAVTGIVDAFNKSDATAAILNTIPWVVTIQNGLFLAKNIVFYVSDTEFRTNQNIYFSFLSAFRMESGIEAIMKSADSSNLSSLFFRLSIISFLASLPILIRFINSRSIQSSRERKQVVPLLANGLSTLLMGAGYMALAFDKQVLGWSLSGVADFPLLVIASYLIGFDRQTLHSMFFKKESAAGQNVQPQPQPSASQAP